MSTSNETPSIEAKTKQLLEEALRDVVHQSRSLKSSEIQQIQVSERRRWFAIGLMLIAPFCLAAASFFASHVDSATGVIWVCFAVALLVAAGWQFDKAGKEAFSVKSSLTPKTLTAPVQGGPIRRVK